MHDPLPFSFHAARRCLERGITERQVEDTMTLGCPVRDTGDKLIYARGRMRVIVSDGLIVTAYRKDKVNPKRRIQKRRKLLRKYERGLW